MMTTVVILFCVLYTCYRLFGSALAWIALGAYALLSRSSR